MVNELLKLLPELAVTLRETGAHAQARLQHPYLRLTARQMAAVIHLGRYGEQTMGEFAAGMDMSRAAATELVERLEEKGMVLREHDTADRRQIRVRLDDRAAEQVRAALEQRRADLRRALESCPDLDPQVLARFLRALIEQMKGQPQ